VSTTDQSATLPDERHTTRQAAVATQKACAWCGSLVVLSCLLGLAVFAHFAPPPAATMTDVEIGAVFRDHTTGIRIGMMLMVFGAALLGPFVAVISAHMRRVEGPRPTLSYLQLMLGACFIMEIIFPCMAVQTAAYRPERMDVVQQVLNDWGWLTFFGVASTAFVQCVIIGALILQDRRATPVFPRWSGYFNIWVGLMFTPGTVVVFFKSGPLSWTGLFIFWLPFFAFFAWLIVMTVLLLKAIDHETAEEIAAEAAGTVPDPRFGELAEQLAQVTAELGDMRQRLSQVESQPIP
jgi:hypothetical protein